MTHPPARSGPGPLDARAREQDAAAPEHRSQEARRGTLRTEPDPHDREPTPASAARVVLEVVPPAMRAIRQRMRSAGASGLSVPQFRALLFVRRHPGTDLSTIAEHLGTSVPAASELVNRLVRQGLVLRAADERERRRICLTLSDTGGEDLERAERETVAWLEARLAAVEPDRLALLVRALQELRGLLDDGTADIPPVPAPIGRRAAGDAPQRD